VGKERLGWIPLRFAVRFVCVLAAVHSVIVTAFDAALVRAGESVLQLCMDYSRCRAAVVPLDGQKLALTLPNVAFPHVHIAADPQFCPWIISPIPPVRHGVNVTTPAPPLSLSLSP
jgi:hypothetical protein